jgi:hypothetical protein
MSGSAIGVPAATHPRTPVAADPLWTEPPAPSRESGARVRVEPTQRAPAPPTVRIDQIAIVTPPARAAAPDPFGSLGARRSGRSRHGGAT